MRWRPAASEERWMAVRELAGDGAATDAETGGWRRIGPLPRCGFFFLALLFCGAMWLFCDGIAKVPVVFGGLVVIAAAELMLYAKLWRFGIEEGLYLGGALMMAEAFMRGRWTADAFALAAGVMLTIAAIRLLNPLFLAFALMSFAWCVRTSPVAVNVAWAALIASPLLWLVLAKRFERPSMQRFVEWMSVTVPVVAYWGVKGYWFDLLDAIDGPESIARRLGNSPVVVGLVLLALGAAALAIGLRLRQHAPLIASGALFALAAFELRHLTDVPLEWKLVCYGAVLLGASAIADRSLRRKRGVTSVALGPESDAWRLVDVGLAARGAVQHDAPPAEAGGFQAGGGTFGGGGSSGTF